jgi:1-acyl-sn-glycerol-3-phosphate acyltransferase
MSGEPPLRGWTALQALGRTLLRWTGWRIVGELPHESKFVAIVAPHSSNWDFPVGVMAMLALDLDVHWFGKESLFRWPLGPVLRRLGGRPVRRETPDGVVAEIASAVRASDHFILALAPEGTRKRVAAWRTGFYRIAEQAGVPIVPVTLDWSRREVGIRSPVCTSGDLAAEVATLQACFSPEMAFRPASFWGPPDGEPRRS